MKARENDMKQTRGNYFAMMGIGLAVLYISTTIATCLPSIWKTLVPVPPDDRGLYDFAMFVLAMSPFIGGFRAFLAIEARWLPRCKMSDEQRKIIETHVLPLRGTIDRLVMWMATGCVVVVLINYF